MNTPTTHTHTYQHQQAPPGTNRHQQQQKSWPKHKSKTLILAKCGLARCDMSFSSSQSTITFVVLPVNHPSFEDARLRPIRLRPAGRNRIGRSRNWPKLKLIGRSRTDGVCFCFFVLFLFFFFCFVFTFLYFFLVLAHLSLHFVSGCFCVPKNLN